MMMSVEYKPGRISCSFRIPNTCQGALDHVDLDLNHALELALEAGDRDGVDVRERLQVLAAFLPCVGSDVNVRHVMCTE
jgi:hypothetical protein